MEKRFNHVFVSHFSNIALLDKVSKLLFLSFICCSVICTFTSLFRLLLHIEILFIFLEKDTCPGGGFSKNINYNSCLPSTIETLVSSPVQSFIFVLSNMFLKSRTLNSSSISEIWVVPSISYKPLKTISDEGLQRRVFERHVLILSVL